MSPDQIKLLRESFSRVEEQADIAALVFYRNLFLIAPELRPMFSTSIEVQSRKLMESLRHTVAMFEQPETLIPILEGLGRRHLSYGTKPAHYDIVIAAMLRSLAEVLDRRFTAETAAVWHDALTFVSAVMQRGAAAAVPAAP